MIFTSLFKDKDHVETNGENLCARALYDYQAGEFKTLREFIKMSLNFSLTPGWTD